MRRRTLVLKKEGLQELDAPGLAMLAAGAPPTWDCQTVGLTCTLGWTERICPVPVTIELDCLP